ncbi:hypothetical protein ONZ45_g18061 [Pleurotus djamor]|nr:hypothetical protein ONZ45_g18061 [Pleurotus djamor]
MVRRKVPSQEAEPSLQHANEDSTTRGKRKVGQLPKDVIVEGDVQPASKRVRRGPSTALAQERPKRSTRSKASAVPVKSKPTQTAKEAKEAKAANALKKKMDAEAMKEELVAMEIDESFEQGQERLTRVRRLSGMVGGISDEGEFAGLCDMEFSDSDDAECAESSKSIRIENTKGSEEPGLKKKAPKTGGTLRSDVATGKKQASQKQATQGKNILPLASGFKTAWVNANAKAQTSKGSSKAKGSAPDNVQANTIDDETAASTRPDYPPSPKKFDRRVAAGNIASSSKRNPLRKNHLVSYEQEVEPVEESTSAPSMRPVDVAEKKSVDNSKGAKRQPMKGRTKPAPAPVLAPPAFVMPKGGLSVKSLPSEIFSLKDQYLAALYGALYASLDPFASFTVGSAAFLTVSRTAFTTVWPTLGYSLQTDDTLFKIGVQRLAEKRGKIYAAVSSSLARHFSGLQLSASDIVEWTRWFRGTWGSPIFYQVPIPQDGVWDDRLPGYKKPEGFLRSTFLIELGKRFLPDIKDSPIKYGPPSGLFILLLTSYERAVRAYSKQGTYIDPGDFRAESCNTWVRQYSKNFENKPKKWWDKILEYYDDEPSDDDEEAGGFEASMLDMRRAALPMSSSPPRD